MSGRSRVLDALSDRAVIARVYSYAAYRVGAGVDAEDVTAETFERAMRYMQSFDPKRGDVTSWLIGISRRVIAGQPMREQPPTGPLDAAVDGPEVGSLRTIQLAAAVATLDERDREIIALRFGADLTAKEIARVLELRVNTVEVALYRALARLRHELGEADTSARPGFTAPAPNGS